MYFCKPANPQDLAQAIKFLKNNPSTRAKIAQQAHEIYKQKFSPKVIGKILKNYIEEIS